MSDSIQLYLINQSQDTNNSTVVIFQKNVAMPNAPVVTWRCLHDTMGGEPYAFTYAAGLSVSATDAQGADTGRVLAQPQMRVSDQGFGLEIVVAEDAAPYLGNKISVQNALPQGEIVVRVYRDDLLLAQANAPAGQAANFEFTPVLWMNIVQGLEEGDLMSDAIVSGTNTSVSLNGITGGSIIITGGGPNQAVAFALTNATKST